MPNTLTITLTNPNAVYYPNQVVSGTVELKVLETIKKAKGLRLIIEGEAVCKWTESSGTGSNRRTTTYYGEEKYVNSVSYLFGSKDGEPTEVLQGIQTYNFECLLPEPIPYSVEGKHGHVRYKVDVNLDIPWAFDIHEVQPFTVVRCEDLNVWLSDYLWQPQSVEEKKVFCCWFCRSDPLFVTVSVLKTGFVLGDCIPILVELVNKSNTNVLYTNFALKKIEQYYSQGPFEKEKCIKDVVVEKTGVGAKAGETVIFEELIEIPQIIMTSNSRYNQVFHIKYEIKVTVETEGMSVSPDLYIPIVIGNLPIREAGSWPSISFGSPQRELPPSFEEATKNP